MTSDRSSRVFSFLIALSSFTVVLQGVWAGLFLREGEGYDEEWIDVHGDGGLIALGLAILACAFGLLQLRARRWLVALGLVYAALLAVEVYLGGLVGETGGLAAIHIPLALVIVALGTHLFLRSWS
ncbi:MAG: hypothetical protein LLG14_21110 [Nocardiaceae bacterium]|nr:hypothetical protein [Nocardiaceae bacterium]